MTGERQFGPYRLVRQIAVGGMAELHLAKTRGIAGFEKYVALKMIHPNFSMDDNFIEMLIDEAKISVQLQHVNIAQTFDLGRVGDTYYITMEYVDGADLYKVLRRASEKQIDMPVDVAAFIAKEVANGLDYAHRRRDVHGQPMSIVHRDVSPQNVLIAHSGEVKLVDFGIAKATMKARQTAVGVIKGKYYYMSPEQAWGDTVDHRTDIFSTGIMLYESLTGQMLYLEEDLHRLLELVRQANIAPPTTLRRDIPPQLERIVMHALRGPREARYQTAGDMATDLERFLHVYSPVFTPAKLSEFCRRVLDDEPLPVAAPARSSNRPISMATQEISDEELMRASSEFADENSVIFRVSEVEKRGRSQEPPPRRALPLSGRPSLGDLDNIEEQTVVSAPPGFGGMSRAAGDYGEAGDMEATLVGSAFDADSAGDEVDEEEALTLRHDPRQVKQMVASATARPRTPPPTPARQSVNSGRKRPGEANPVLSARVPQPAVSELRGARQSRKTPAKGVPAAGGASLVSSLLGAPEAAPVRRDAPGLPLPPGPPDPPSPSVAPGQGSATPMPAAGQANAEGPMAGAGQGSAPMAAQAYPQPGLATPPGMVPVAGYGPPNTGPFPMGLPGQPGMSGGMQAMGFDPFSPLPSGNVGMTFTKQLQALELEEIPDAYKIRRKKPQWLWRALAGGVLLLAGVVLGVVLFTRQSHTVETALLIDSIPSGARVSVDDAPLAERTPVRWPEAQPRTRYKLTFELDGYQPYSRHVQVGAGGGDVQVKVVLDRAPTTARLTVESTPTRAEIFINGKSLGRTPRTIDSLDPRQATELELRHPDYKPHHETIQWGDETALERHITLQK